MPLLFNGVGGIKKVTYNEALYKKVKLNGVIVHSGAFSFEYTGDWEFDSIGEEDLSGDFQIRFLTNGTLTIVDHGSTGGYFDVFLVGGGGAGGGRRGWYNNLTSSWQWGGIAGKGGAGETVTKNNVFIAQGVYPLVIGEQNGATEFANIYSAPGGTSGTNAFPRGNPDWVSGTDGVTIDDVGVYAFGANSGNLYCRSNQEEATPNSGNGGKQGGTGSHTVDHVQLGVSGSSGVIVLRNHRT